MSVLIKTLQTPRQRPRESPHNDLHQRFHKLIVITPPNLGNSLSSGWCANGFGAHLEQGPDSV